MSAERPRPDVIARSLRAAPEGDDADRDEPIADELDLPLTDDEGDDPGAGEPGDAGDAGELDDDLLPPEGEGDDPLDDAAAADLEIGDDLDPVDEEGGLGDEGEVDVGALDEGLDLDDDERLGEDDPQGSIDEDDDELDDDGGDDDGGAEGTGEAPEDEVDEAALPELDADAEGDEGDDALSEALLAELGGAAIPWDAARWTALAGAGATVPASALGIGAGRVAAAGEVLLLVGEGESAARQVAFGEGATAVALTDDLLVAAAARGQLLVSRHGADEAASLDVLRSGRGPIALAATPGRVWLHEGDALHCLTSPEEPLTTLRDRGVLAIAAAGGALLAVTRGDGGPSIERLRSDDEGWQATALRGAEARLVEGGGRRGNLTLAAGAGGRSLAITDGAVVAVSRDGGATFAVADLGPPAAIAFAGDDDALLVLTTDGALVRAPARAEPTRVAAVEGLGDGAAAIGWDAARDQVWIACRAGLLAFGRTRRH